MPFAVDTLEFEMGKPGEVIDRVAQLRAQAMAHALPAKKMFARETARRR